jgi:fructose-1,6-bisphosphatase I
MKIGNPYITEVSSEQIPTKGGRITLLKEHIPDNDGDLKDLILKISEIGKTIQNGFIRNQGISNTKNMYGETQVEMDKWADRMLVEGLKDLPYIACISSEERDDVIKCQADGRFSVCFDPLDGSSLMGVNLTVGTIVGIHERKDPFGKGCDLSGALYILYGPLTTLTYTIGEGVHEFVLNDEDDLVLQKENLKIGETKIHAPGGLRKKYLPYHLRFIERLEEEGYKLRFCGAFVADVHQIIYKGGVFTYPATEGNEKGKLRLLFEANPMGFIVSQAGGAISDSDGDILQIEPQSLDHRVPIYIGGKKEIQIIEEEKRREAQK